MKHPTRGPRAPRGPVSPEDAASMTVSHVEPVVAPSTEAARFSELTASLDRETEIVEALRAALIRQREAVAGTHADRVNQSVDAIGRILLTLEEARRRRGAMLAALTGDAHIRLERLESIAGPSPKTLVAARARLRGAAESVAREIAINRGVLRHAVESGEAFLQALFSTTADPAPVYGAQDKEEPPSGLLLDRRA